MAFPTFLGSLIVKEPQVKQQTRHSQPRDVPWTSCIFSFPSYTRLAESPETFWHGSQPSHTLPVLIWSPWSRSISRAAPRPIILDMLHVMHLTWAATWSNFEERASPVHTSFNSSWSPSRSHPVLSSSMRPRLEGRRLLSFAFPYLPLRFSHWDS